MRRAALACATWLALAPPLAAQQVSLLAGGAHARYADTLAGTAGLLSARLSGASRLTAVSFEANFSQFVTGEWATQLATQGTALFPLARRVALGIAGGGAASNFEGGTWSGAGGAGPLLAISSRRWLATVGASAGGVRRVDQTNLGMVTGSVRLRYTLPSGVAVEGGVSGTAADTIQYTDATASVSVRTSRLLFAVSAGARTGNFSDDPWAQARLELFATGTATVEAALGRYPRDLTGFTDGLFVNLGVRLRLAGSAPPRRAATARPPVRVERLGATRVRISLEYRGDVDRLEIAGDWNGWTPVPLARRAEGRWVAEFQLEPGVYKYALLADGHWTLPEGAVAVPDDFGGKVGLLVVR